MIEMKIKTLEDQKSRQWAYFHNQIFMGKTDFIQNGHKYQKRLTTKVSFRFRSQNIEFYNEKSQLI